MMRLQDFDYCLPEQLIAQEPLRQRSGSRLMVLRRGLQEVRHHQFQDLPGLLLPGDVLVRNETRVIPARLIGRKASGGQVEILLTRSLDAGQKTWQCLTRSAQPTRVGTRIEFAGGVHADITGVEADGYRLIRFCAGDDVAMLLERHGHMPLPPYIRRQDQPLDRERYQTVFARHPGAVAAPTAGLHFTADTFELLEQRGIVVCGVTLHVGPGTFLPVRTEDLSRHRMHKEAFLVPAETAGLVNAAKAEGRRIVALGTTVTRTLEFAVDEQGMLQAGQGETDLFIAPGFQFRLVDALITNFHLPKSTLLMLVAAFAGRDFILKAYREAIARQYRFFSYGDCMLIE